MNSATPPEAVPGVIDSPSQVALSARESQAYLHCEQVTPALPSEPMGEKRTGSVPLPQWWLEDVKGLVGETNRKYQGKDVAAAIGGSPSTISRLLSAKVSAMDKVAAVSHFLGIPVPFAVFASRARAIEFQQRVEGDARHRKAALAIVDEMVGQLPRELTSVTKSLDAGQATTLQTEHERRAAKRKRAGGRRGRGARRVAKRRRAPK